MRTFKKRTKSDELSVGENDESEGWLTYLAFERSAAREAVFRLSAATVAVPGAALAILTALGIVEGISPLAWLTIVAFVVWTECLLFAAIYAFYQYAGTVKSIMRRHFHPEERSAILRRLDFQHLMVRDVGVLLVLMSPWTTYYWIALRDYYLPDVLRAEREVINLLSLRKARPDWEQWARQELPLFQTSRFTRLFGWRVRSPDDFPRDAIEHVESWALASFRRLRLVFLLGIISSAAGVVFAFVSLVVSSFPASGPAVADFFWLPLDQTLQVPPILLGVASLCVTCHLFLLRAFIGRISSYFATLNWLEAQKPKGPIANPL